MRLADPSPLARRDALIARVDDVVRSILGRRNGEWHGEVFPERLLALRHVEALPSYVREVRVAPGTVITPLAADELRRRGVAIRWVSRRDIEAVRPSGEWGFAIEGESGVLTALRRTWLEERDPWRELAAANDAALWVAQSARRGAVVVTDEAAVAAWRANQLAGVRAASAETVAAVARAVRGLGLNLLVVEPSGKPLPLLRRLAAEFRSAGAPTAPETLWEEAAPCVSPK